MLSSMYASDATVTIGGAKYVSIGIVERMEKYEFSEWVEKIVARRRIFDQFK